MKCPNCRNKMKYKNKGEWGYPFTTGPEPDYPDWFKKDIYKCKDCNIKKINNEWKVPKELRPTKKQIKTIHYINNRLGMDLEAITKLQCHKVIKKYLNDARQPKLSYEDVYGYGDNCFAFFEDCY